MATTALTSADISLPSIPDAPRVRDRIAALADTVDLVGLTDNHAGQPHVAAGRRGPRQGTGRCDDRARLVP
jgi:hypothetical protein